MEMNAPITLEMKVWAIEEDTGNTALVTMSLPRGQYPTVKTIKTLIDNAKNQLPKGYALMNKSEFFNAILADEYGPQSMRFATPGSNDFINDVIEMEPANDSH
ncbi:hypothetical protein [Acinetobacter lwoffii]|uniref:hypothetical protein n=1 Tax=Acinetobacter lwoffii TaxID=28090 RepID=UPI00209B69B3|nr:hypothetical protein [Acinetobacter lwoffii]MCO8080266.1 hypothetical protein [Acinetobacter lwoffii]